eukprot:TRINITY_DN2836_c0_g2_i3.p1 TRINITY_DN2836_c0_g2~~TRINITY_DN2836_c0_g2_i3.p1  ORF type:complete len:1451 (-),score=559.69 TRINITY_DN2836_c0_g2_i3:47-4399(-)
MATMNKPTYAAITTHSPEKPVLVFVSSRRQTRLTAQDLIAFAAADENPRRWLHMEEHELDLVLSKINDQSLKHTLPFGIALHHAGLTEDDKKIVEELFEKVKIQILISTATLAWGVNLPAHTVIIKGTQLYNSAAGKFVELGMLDVMQIFGRAGRPQFDTSGEAIIITSYDELPRYLALLNTQLPIESQLNKRLPDHLNAEIVLGTVTNVREAVTWLGYTYLYRRMGRNPLVYGLTYEERETDPNLTRRCRDLVVSAATTLDKSHMINFDENGGNFTPTDLGRVASHYYINHETVDTFNSTLEGRELSKTMSEPEILAMAAQAQEFENVMLREEELEELDKLQNETCAMPVKGGVENKHGKVNILLQAYLSHAAIDGFSLVSDSAYVVQNISRLLRGLFEITLKKGWATVSLRLLTLCKMIDRRLWSFQHPLRQFPNVTNEILYKLEQKNCDIDKLTDMEAGEIGILVNHPRLGSQIQRIVRQFPKLEIGATVHPLTRTVLRIDLEIFANFEWDDRIHGSVDPWWIWIEDGENEVIYHSEYLILNKKQIGDVFKVSFTIPITEPLPPQYFIHAVSDRWLGAECVEPISFKHLILPHIHPPHTELLDLEPLPLQALKNPEYEKLYNFSHFNPIQTQIFHTLYYTNNNVLLGAPTGSGKTITAEIAMFKLFRDTPHLKVVYIGPLKALVRERLNDWSVRFGKRLGKKVVELTGDYTPNVQALISSDIVLTTPEKWDGISRNWQHRSYVKAVGLVVIDEIHLLGDERGPILEVIVSRMRYIAQTTENNIRIIGLSTALANARDLGDWLGIDQVGLFNFRPSVRPVPLEAHIQGYPGNHYCPRMATMNKPTYAAITTHSPEKPVLVFVSSRRQTRLTAQDLIAFAAADENPRRWLHMEEHELDLVLSKINDQSLKHTLPFGIALHHAGLTEDDKKIVEELFEKVKIQILISTATLAWGVNLPAYLVVIKGTEYFEASSRKYVDFPITDVLQMMGRAGRPQYDHNGGKAVILVHEPKKYFYKKFLYEPFPVESSLLKVLHDHINAEIVAGTIASKQDAIEFLTWTYFCRRLLMNPSYYGLEDASAASVNAFLSSKIDETLDALEKGKCISLGSDPEIESLTMGRILSYYYLHYTTALLFASSINASNDIPSLLDVLTKTAEYSELPVRHNEDRLNESLANDVKIKVDKRTLDSPHTKANLLLQAHFSRMELPISDYVTDTRSVLDQAVRILQAMVDVAADSGWLFTALNTMRLLQMVMQGTWNDAPNLSTLPLSEQALDLLYGNGIKSISELIQIEPNRIKSVLNRILPENRLKELVNIVSILPNINVMWLLNHKVEPSSNVVVKVNLERHSRNPEKGVHAPRFPKFKDEGWWIVLGNAASGDLLALRRITFNHKKSSTNLSFEAPVIPGKYEMTLYFMSDSYIGLDQEHLIQFEVVETKPRVSKETQKLFPSQK